MSSCGVYELMVDVVEHWLREREIEASREDWDVLVERLSAVDEQLSDRYKCQKRSVIFNEYGGDEEGLI